MAGNTRGRLKERFEGMHKNYDWIQNHCAECIKLIDGRKANLTEALAGMAENAKTLDKLLMKLYSTL